MHRATPLQTSFRSYSSGGSRSVVDKVDDTTQLQEMAGNFMANETRNAVECPQNYGFTSVVFDAEKDQMGKAVGAEVVQSFLGGNRSYPVAGAMDDRRHRMFKLGKGDTAMFRGRGDKQQFHMTQDGGFWTAPQDKTVRMHLLQEDSATNSTTQQQGSSGGSGGGSAGGQSHIATRDGNGSTGSGGQSGGQQQQQRGQEARYKDGQKSPMFVDVTKDASRVSGAEVHLMLGDGKIYVHVIGGEVYLGAKKGEATFGKVATDAGVSVNVYAKIG
jgi:phage gp45-like